MASAPTKATNVYWQTMYIDKQSRAEQKHQRPSVLWFTGQNGIYGRLDPAVGDVEVFAALGGRGPYGIATTPGGDVYYASLAVSYVGLACCLR